MSPFPRSRTSCQNEQLISRAEASQSGRVFASDDRSFHGASGNILSVAGGASDILPVFCSPPLQHILSGIPLEARCLARLALPKAGFSRCVGQQSQEEHQSTPLVGGRSPAWALPMTTCALGLMGLLLQGFMGLFVHGIPVQGLGLACRWAGESLKSALSGSLLRDATTQNPVPKMGPKSLHLSTPNPPRSRKKS